jgi:hypothetical protein
MKKFCVLLLLVLVACSQLPTIPYITPTAVSVETAAPRATPAVQQAKAVAPATTGIQYCYVKHLDPAKIFKNYSLNAVFEAVQVYPAPTGPGEGQSGWIALNSTDLDYFRALNASNGQFINWAFQTGSGSLYASPLRGSIATTAHWFVVAMSGNIVEVTDVRNGRARIAGLANASDLDAAVINRDAAPYFVDRVMVLWRDGHISDTPAGLGYMPVWNPDQFYNHGIDQLWMNLSDLVCTVDLARSYKTTIASWVTLGLRVHSAQSLTGSNITHYLYAKDAPFWIWKTDSVGGVTWGLTDWGWAVLSMNGAAYTEATP